jgi:hypothetical protein
MRFKNKLGITFVLLLTFSFFINVHATTIEDSSISVKEGQTYNWNYLKATQLLNTSDRVRFTIDNIYKGEYMTDNVAVLNATINYFSSYKNAWEVVIENEEFMYFNGTTDFIYYTGFFTLVYGWMFVLPNPFNLTLVGDYMNATLGGQFTTILTIGNQLVLYDFDDEITLSYLFNDDGLLLRYDIVEADEIIITLVLAASEQGISLGYTFIPILIISTFGIVVYRKRKLKIN